MQLQSLFTLVWSLIHSLDRMLTVGIITMPWAPVLTSLATVQANRMGEPAKGLPADWESGVSPGYPCAPQPGEC